MLIEITMLLALSVPRPRCEPGEHQLSLEPQKGQLITVHSSADPLYSEGLESALAQDLSLLSEVNRIFVERAEGNLLVWISVDNPSREVRERIFERQFDLIDAFPEVSFDFNVIPSERRNAQEFASEAQLIFERER